MEIINLDMLKNPLNWLTVFLMLVLFLMFVDVFARLWTVSASNLPGGITTGNGA